MGYMWWFPLNLAAAVFELAFCIPIAGRLIKFFWNIAISLPHLLAGAVEYGLMGLGFQPEKKMRVNVILFKGEDGEALAEIPEVVDHLQKTIDFYQTTANIRLLPASGATNQTGEEGRSKATEAWIRVPESTPGNLVLKLACNLPAVVQDFWLTGMMLQFNILKYFFPFSFLRLIGYGAAVTVFIVEDIKDHGGCSLGPFTDYVTIQYDRLNCIAHEIGHACNILKHSDDPSNLMNAKKCGNTGMTLSQIALVRSSRHVTFV